MRAALFIRGVNVGGHNKLPMATLRRLASDVGFTGVATYIQSGNLVVHSDSDDLDAICETVRVAIADVAGIDTPVIGRTREALVRILTDNPFVAAGVAPDRVNVALLDRPGPNQGLLDPPEVAPDRVWVVGADAYLHTPNGLGRTRLSTSALKRLLGSGTASTTRNLSTLHKMVELLGVG